MNTTPIKTELTYSEMATLVAEVVNNCFEQNEAGEDVNYIPAIKHPALCAAIVEYYYGFEYSKDPEANYKEYIRIDVDKHLMLVPAFAPILKAIEEEIDFRKQKLIHKSPLDELFGEITKIVKTMSGSLDISSLGEIAKKFSTIEKLDEKAIVAAIVGDKKPAKKPQDRKPRAKKVVNIDEAK